MKIPAVKSPDMKNPAVKIAVVKSSGRVKPGCEYPGMCVVTKVDREKKVEELEK